MGVGKLAWLIQQGVGYPGMRAGIFQTTCWRSGFIGLAGAVCCGIVLGWGYGHGYLQLILDFSGMHLQVLNPQDVFDLIHGFC